MKKVLSILLCAVIAVSCVCVSADAKSKKKKKVTPPGAPKLTSVSQPDLKILKISWSGVSKAAGYSLYYSTNGKSYKCIKTTSAKSFTHKKLTDNRKYYYKVKAYKKDGKKKVYGKFSNIRTKRVLNNLLAIYSPYRISGGQVFKGDKSFMMSGNKYWYGINMWSCGGYAAFNLKGKYKYIEITYGDIETSRYCVLDVLSDDEVVKSLRINEAAIEKTLKINIQNANKLEFKISDAYYRQDNLIGIANIKLYK